MKLKLAYSSGRDLLGAQKRLGVIYDNENITEELVAIDRYYDLSIFCGILPTSRLNRLIKHISSNIVSNILL